jgi:hypothetical protein
MLCDGSPSTPFFQNANEKRSFIFKTSIPPFAHRCVTAEKCKIPNNGGHCDGVTGASRGTLRHLNLNLNPHTA